MVRLEPTQSTKFKLLALSGNQCAFPECTENLVDKGGHFIGQFCHIEAAAEGGERYNAAMSDEDRRDISNLVLLCAKHHIVTDDVKMYPVETMKLMKERHEAKHHDEYTPSAEVMDQIMATVSDTIEKAIAQNRDGFVPYTEAEYLQDMQGASLEAQRQTEGAMRLIYAKGGGDSARFQVSQTFTAEATEKRKMYQRKRAQTVRMYNLRLEQTNDEFDKKEQAVLSQLSARGMSHSGQVTVAKEETEKERRRAIELLNIEFGVSDSEVAS